MIKALIYVGAALWGFTKVAGTLGALILLAEFSKTIHDFAVTEQDTKKD